MRQKQRWNPASLQNTASPAIAPSLLLRAFRQWKEWAEDLHRQGLRWLHSANSFQGHCLLYTLTKAGFWWGMVKSSSYEVSGDRSLFRLLKMHITATQRFLLYSYCMCSLRMLNLVCFANGNGYSCLQWNNDLLILCNNPQKSCDDRST